MAGSAVFAMGSTTFNNQSPQPPSWSTGSAMIEWSLLGGWTSGIWFITVTASTNGPGQEFTHPIIGLAPVDPATGFWADVYSPTGAPVQTNDGGIITITQVPYVYSLVVPLNGNAYELVLYGNSGTTVTLSSALIVHD